MRASCHQRKRGICFRRSGSRRLRIAGEPRYLPSSFQEQHSGAGWNEAPDGCEPFNAIQLDPTCAAWRRSAFAHDGRLEMGSPHVQCNPASAARASRPAGSDSAPHGGRLQRYARARENLGWRWRAGIEFRQRSRPWHRLRVCHFSFWFQSTAVQRQSGLWIVIGLAVGGFPDQL